MEGKLEVKIDKYEINKDNLIDMINNQAIEEALATEHDKDKTTIKNSRFYLDCIRNPKHEGEIEVLPNPGKCEYRLVISENAPKRFCFIRNNILITDLMPHYPTRDRYGLKDYAGVIECINSYGNSFLRNMEPPEHNDLSQDFLAEGRQSEGKKLLIDLAT